MSSLSRVSILRSAAIRNCFRSPALAESGSTFFIRKNFSTSDLEEEKNPVRLENVDTMKCLNRVTLLGRATGPAATNTLGNVNFATFTLVTNELRRNRSNELIRRADFHRIQVFAPRLVDKTKQVVQRGSRILVEGKINYNVRKGEHGNIHFTNITADNVVFITGTRPESQADMEDDDILDEIPHEEQQHQKH